MFDDQIFGQSEELFELNEYMPAIRTGVNRAETETFGTCVVSSGVNVADAFEARLYNETRIRNRSDLDRALNISASFSAKNLFGSVSASGGYFKANTVREDRVFWLVDSKYVLNTSKMDGASMRLSDSAQQLLQNYDSLEPFLDACGTHFYSGVQRGARYSLLYEFRENAEKTMESIRAQAGASGFGLRAESEFSRMVSAAERSDYLTVHSHIQGGGSSLLEYATDAAQLKDELTRLRSDVLDHGRAVDLTWYADSYDIFPEFAAAKRRFRQASRLDNLALNERHRDAVLVFLYNLYNSNGNNIGRLRSAQENSRSADGIISLTPEQWNRSNSMISRLQRQNDDLANRSRACIESRTGSDCSSEGFVDLFGDEADASAAFGLQRNTGDSRRERCSQDPGSVAQGRRRVAWALKCHYIGSSLADFYNENQMYPTFANRDMYGFFDEDAPCFSGAPRCTGSCTAIWNL